MEVVQVSQSHSYKVRRNPAFTKPFLKMSRRSQSLVQTALSSFSVAVFLQFLYECEIVYSQESELCLHIKDV